MMGLTFDAGGLIALDRGDRRILVLLQRIRERGEVVVVPVAALAQAIRNPAKQAMLSRFIRQSDTQIEPLGEREAMAAGILLAQTRSSDIADAHVVGCARRWGHAVITSDPDDMRRLAPELRLVIV